MKLCLSQLPNYYVDYNWSPIPDHTQYFVGREIELKGFWYEMVNLHGCGQHPARNMAFVGQRKLGKTAFLKRCYNLAFWEQEEIIPFYYSFAQNEVDRTKNVLQINDLQREMPLIFLQQFLAFITKDVESLDLENYDEVYRYIKAKKINRATKLISGIKNYVCSIQQREGIFALRDIWQLTQHLSFFVRKKCLLVIDEAQEMQTSIYDGKKLLSCKGSIADIIQKQHSLVLISGSHVSMLVNEFLDYDFANRIHKIRFFPLQLKHAKELIQRKKPKNSYRNLAKDLLNLVGGNPYYIDQILGYNMLYENIRQEEKDFSSHNGLQKVFNFEVLHPQGRLYDFWSIHLSKNSEDLNGDPDSLKGLTLQILYKIAKNPGNEFHYHELAQEFNVNTKMIEKKVKQLEDANLLEPLRLPVIAYGFSDKILPVAINNLYHQLILKGPNRKVAKEALDDYLKISRNVGAKKLKAMVNALENSFEKVAKEIADIQLNLVNLHHKIKSARGKMNLKKGMKKENKIRKKIRLMIEKNTGLFAGCKLQGKVHSIYLSGSEGTGCQIDIFAELKKGRKKLAFLAEVKNTKTKVSFKSAEKFVASVVLAKHEYKLKDISCLYISQAGFSKKAQEYLESFDVRCVVDI